MTASFDDAPRPAHAPGQPGLRDDILRSTQLIDAPPEEAFDRLTRIASSLLDAPVALVSLVDGARQFFKSAIGLAEPWATARETPLTHSFCKHVTADRAPLIVADAREHPVLRDNLAIQDLGVIAYAGMPLIVEGEALGALCVIDDQPRVWPEPQLRLLRDLADVVTSEIGLRRTLQAAEKQRALTEALVESLGDGVLAIDPERRFLLANHAARRTFSVGAAVGRRMPATWAINHSSRRADGTPLTSGEGALERGLRGEPTDDLTFQLHRPGAAAPIWVDVTGRPVRDASGRVVASVAVYRDVTERTRQAEAARIAEAAVRRNEQIYRAMVKHLPNGAVLLVDRELRYAAADGPLIGSLLRTASLTGLVGRSVGDVVSAGNRDAIIEAFRATLRGERLQLEVRRGEGCFDLRTVPIYDGDEVTHALAFLYDVSERRRETEELRITRDLLVGERALFETALAHIEDGVALLDADRRLLLANAAYAAMFGFTPEELEGLTRTQFLAHLTPLLEDPLDVLGRLDMKEQESCEEIVLARPHRRVLRRTWASVRLPTQHGYLVTWHDITAQKALLAEREQQLMIDALTGIPNRLAGQAALEVERARMQRTGAPLCVAVFDIDHFKRVNDDHGHATGDRVLCQVARALADQVRITDTVARWGGEEFLAVLPADLAGARVFCERARQAIEQLACPEIQRITTSVGVAEVGLDEDPRDAIARADLRLYEAKRAGRNRVES